MPGPLTPEIWYAALASQCGIVIATDDPTLARQRLYEMRKRLADPDLDNLAIMTPKDEPNHLWLVKKVRS